MMPADIVKRSRAGLNTRFDTPNPQAGKMQLRLNVGGTPRVAI
jgi:hypothetical protein